jgi:16S rRNA C1402 N4-methylase RsmH
MVADPESFIQYNKNIVKNIFRKKEEYHQDQARLPIEEKIKILIELQKISLTIRPKQDETDKRLVWQI